MNPLERLRSAELKCEDEQYRVVIVMLRVATLLEGMAQGEKSGKGKEELDALQEQVRETAQLIEGMVWGGTISTQQGADAVGALVSRMEQLESLSVSMGELIELQQLATAATLPIQGKKGSGVCVRCKELDAEECV